VQFYAWLFLLSSVFCCFTYLSKLNDDDDLMHFRTGSDLISLLILLFFFLLLFLLERPLHKSPRLRHFISDRNEIWQDCSSNKYDKYASIDAVGFPIKRHIPSRAMTSFHTERCCHLVSAHIVSARRICIMQQRIHCESEKNWATFIFTVTLANVGRFLKFFHCRNQKEMAHNNNEKFPTVA